MRTLLAIITLTLSNFAAYCADSNVEAVLSFSLTATNEGFSKRLEEGLWLRDERDELGWEVGVFRNRSPDNLLYPQSNWHGAFPCELSAWSHRTMTFPGDRIIPVRGVHRSVRIRLIDPAVTRDSGNERFTGGRVEIYWENDA